MNHSKPNKMKTILDRANTRGHADYGWLNTWHTFSFADYYNPSRIHFGALRVLNDDTVAPGMGFDTHPHKNMEVVSIPLKGYLRHGDNLEHSEVITPGDIQVMSTGTGIYHSEYNDSKTENLEFLQIWVIPRINNTRPVYKSYDIRPIDKKNRFGYIIAPDGSAPTGILQDAWFSLGELDQGKQIDYQLHQQNTGVYCFVIEGEVQIGNTILKRRDGMGIYETGHFRVETLKPSHLLLMEVALI